MRILDVSDFLDIPTKDPTQDCKPKKKKIKNSWKTISCIRAILIYLLVSPLPLFMDLVSLTHRFGIHSKILLTEVRGCSMANKSLFHIKEWDLLRNFIKCTIKLTIDEENSSTILSN